MNLVDRHGRVQRVHGGALLEECGILPGVIEVPNYGCRARRLFCVKPHRIGFFGTVAVLARCNAKFVQRAFFHAGDKTFPYSGITARLELMRLRIPRVEASDDRDLPRIGRPDAEDRSRGSLGFDKVRAHLLVDPIVTAFIK